MALYVLEFKGSNETDIKYNLIPKEVHGGKQKFDAFSYFPYPVGANTKVCFPRTKIIIAIKLQLLGAHKSFVVP